MNIKEKLISFKADLLGARKSFTIWFNSTVATVYYGLPMLQESLPQLQAYIPTVHFNHIMATVIVVNLLLRFKTTKSLKDK